MTTSLEDPVERLRRECRGNAARARGGTRPEEPARRVLHLDEQGVWLARRARASARAERGYDPTTRAVREHGISEGAPLDFHSPYGCSKGAATSTCIDYARSFGLRAVVFRMSCIYGPAAVWHRGSGVGGAPASASAARRADHASTAMVIRCAICCSCRPDGCLFGRTRSGGQPAPARPSTSAVARRTPSACCDVVERLAALTGNARPDSVSTTGARGDQRYYVSDTRKFSELTGWHPQVAVTEGMARLCEWLRDRREPGALPQRIDAQLAERVAS